MKWEYLVEHYPLYQDVWDEEIGRLQVSLDVESMQEYLNLQGEAGWELIQRTDKGVCFFKRRRN